MAERADSRSDDVRDYHKRDFPHAAFDLPSFANERYTLFSHTPTAGASRNGIDLERIADLRIGARARRDEDRGAIRPHQLPHAARGGHVADQVRAGLPGR